MTVIAEERVRVGAPRDRIWAVFDDPAALGRVLPGCESLERTGPAAFAGVLATKLQFLTIRADVTARILDPEPPDRLRLELDGRPRGLAGGFRASIPIELTAAEDGEVEAPRASGGTWIGYSVDLTTSGRLASFGAPILRDSFRRQVTTLIANLERELGGG
jgi:carbon monoxide dehydrogenase subunit G